MSASHEYLPGVIAAMEPIVGSPSRRSVTVDGRLAGYVALVGGFDNGTKCWAATDQDGYKLEHPDYLPGAVAQVAANARNEVSEPEGGVRWEHVEVTYTETITRTVKVHVRASEPLTHEALAANEDHLLRLAQAEQHHRGDAHRPRSTARLVAAKSVGHEIAGGAR